MSDPRYAKGYRAGLARKKNDRWNEIFMSLLPVAMQADGWTIGNKAVNSSEDRIRLAEKWADKAVEKLK